MKKSVAIIGGGTAGLFLAAFLNTDKFDVTIYEKNGSLGRKFLVAGDGGFNLTHSEELPKFKSRYTPSSFLSEALDDFNNADLQKFMLGISIPTFVGSSGRVFPEKGIKPIKVLKSVEAHLIEKGVRFEFSKNFAGWNENNSLKFNIDEIITANFTVFALGGASWKVTGSDGSWSSIFNKKGIETLPFKPANCAYAINWSEKFSQKNEGKPLKNITVSIDDKTQKGEAVITKFGIEGNAIYGLSPEIQSALNQRNEAIVYFDFKPMLTQAELIEKLSNVSSNTTTALRKSIKLPPAVIDLIKISLTKEEFTDIQTLTKFIKKFPLKIHSSAEIDEAISTTGGIFLKAVNENFELKDLENQFCIGEMLDWNAPTGGYLIQGCASMGVHLARRLNDK